MSNVSVSNVNLKYPIGKPIFAVNTPLKLFHATVANTNTESLKSLHTLFDTYSDYMLAKFEPNRTVRNIPNLSFSTKNKTKQKTEFFYNHFRQIVDAIL